MKRIITLISLGILLIVLFPNILKASHYSGGDLTYTCIGGNSYQITYTFYRDCSGIAAPLNIGLNFSCGSNSNYNFNYSINRVIGTGQEVTLHCSNVQSSCGSGNSYGVQEYVYQGNVTLPSCSDWTIVSTSCCRNPITTVYANDNNGWYNLATLDNQNAVCNSSPTFNSKPSFILYTNQLNCMDLGATDPDGDTLVYSLIPPKTSATSSVIYNSPWSYTNFLTAQSPQGISIDSTTGQVCFTPTVTLTTIFAIKVDQYRTINGTLTLIGSIIRDVQVTVINGSNTIPALSGINLNANTYNPSDTTYNVNICAVNTPISFNIYGFDADTFNSATSGSPEKFNISWDSSIVGATFTPHYNGTDSAYATFSWTPASSSLGTTICFNATITDEACPYYGYKAYKYCMTVGGNGTSVSIGSDTLLCRGEIYTVQAVADTSTTSYSWKLDGNSINIPQNQNWYAVNSSNLSTGAHILSIEVNNGNPNSVCNGNDQINIEVMEQPQVHGTLSDTVICNNQFVFYDAGPGQIYKWGNINGSLLSNAQIFIPTSSGTYTLFVDGGINTRCTDSDTFTVAITAMPPTFNLGNDTSLYATNSLTLSMPAVNNALYLWNTGATSPSIIVDSNTTVNEIIGIVYFNSQCFTTDTINVLVYGMGIDEQKNTQLKIYPNPVHHTMKIEMDKAYANSNIEVLDMNGKVVLSTKFSGKNYELKNLEKLTKGVYLLRVQNKELNVLLRFVKE